MSTGLTIIPLRDCSQLPHQNVFAFTQIKFIDDYCIFGQITDMANEKKPYIPKKPHIKTQPLPSQAQIIIYKQGGMKTTREDDWGFELTFAYAEDLKALNVPEDVHPFNKAIIAFINALPNDTPIILYWE